MSLHKHQAPLEWQAHLLLSYWAFAFSSSMSLASFLRLYSSLIKYVAPMISFNIVLQCISQLYICSSVWKWVARFVAFHLPMSQQSPVSGVLGVSAQTSGTPWVAGPLITELSRLRSRLWWYNRLNLSQSHPGMLEIFNRNVCNVGDRYWEQSQWGYTESLPNCTHTFPSTKSLSLCCFTLLAIFHLFSVNYSQCE